MGPRGSSTVSLAFLMAARKRSRSSTFPSTIFAASATHRPALYMIAVKYAGVRPTLASASFMYVRLAGVVNVGAQMADHVLVGHDAAADEGQLPLQPVLGVLLDEAHALRRHEHGAHRVRV